MLCACDKALTKLSVEKKQAEDQLKKAEASFESDRVHFKEKEYEVATVVVQASAHLSKMKNYFNKEVEVQDLCAKLNQCNAIIDFLPFLSYSGTILLLVVRLLKSLF